MPEILSYLYILSTQFITVYFNERRFYQANTNRTLPAPDKEASQHARVFLDPFKILRNNNGDDVSGGRIFAGKRH